MGANAIPHKESFLSKLQQIIGWTDMNEAKNKYFSKERYPIFHYCVSVHDIGGVSESVVGISRDVPASDFVVDNYDEKSSSYQNYIWATFMHELGHNLGLRHGGFEDDNYKPNYLSIMNYRYDTGIYVQQKTSEGTKYYPYLVYSYFKSGEVIDLNENEIIETQGLGETLKKYNILVYHYICNEKNKMELDYFSTSTSKGIDFNKNSEYESEPYRIELNDLCNPNYKILKSQNDWENLKFNVGWVGSKPLTYQMKQRRMK